MTWQGLKGEPMVASLTKEETSRIWAKLLADNQAQQTFQEARRLVAQARSLGENSVCLELGLSRARDLFLVVGRELGNPSVEWLAGVEIRLVKTADHMAVLPVTREPRSLRDILHQRQSVRQ